MAVAVDIIGMRLTDEQEIHPFFAQSEANNGRQSHAQSNFLQEDSRTTLSNVITAKTSKLGIDAPVSPGTGSEKLSEPYRKFMKVTIKSHDSPNNEGERLHTNRKESLDHERQYVNENEYLNHHRSKRRRTLSLSPPADANAWSEQLQAAASGGPTQLSSDFVCPQTSEGQFQTSSKMTETLDEGLTPTTDHNTKPSCPTHIEDLGQIGTATTSSALGSPKSRTSRKKLLKLKANGRLTSPSSRTARSSIIKPRDRGFPSKQPSQFASRVVTIKYGTSEDLRISTGKRIKELIESTSHASPTALGKVLPSKLATSPKPMHPFFLGKTRLASNSTMLEVSNVPVHGKSDGSISQDLSEGPTPKKHRESASITGNIKTLNALPSSVNDQNVVRDSKAFKASGLQAVLWPPKDLVHVTNLDSNTADTINASPKAQIVHTHQKMKGAQVHLSKQENVLYALTSDIGDISRNKSDEVVAEPSVSSNLRLPVRRIMSAEQLQQAVRQRLSDALPIEEAADYKTTHAKINSSRLNSSSNKEHVTLSQLDARILTSSSAFDKAECESQLWVNKYAPKSANEVLQQGLEPQLMRNWLESLTVASVVPGYKEFSKTSRGSITKAKQGKRKRKERLDEFVVFSDEEADEMTELPDLNCPSPSYDPLLRPKKTMIRPSDLGQSNSPEEVRAANAVVISGPHGCGKSAAVYAVAQELGFEVFEINPGSRRSGKDLLDRVGSMSKNHLVHPHTNLENRSNVEELSRVAETFKQDLISEQQAGLTSFFKPRRGQRPSNKGGKKKGDRKLEDEDSLKKTYQKQSLILLEEVDVLFEEDKHFWMATLSLIMQSKRPLILTCTDERLLPIGEMSLHAIYRFSPAPELLAADHMMLTAANEGHLLSHRAILQLYRAKKCDLRASITELQFFCQMGIGDNKGGLEWMLDREIIPTYAKENQEHARIVSEDTYLCGMGWLNLSGVEHRKGDLEETEEDELLSDALSRWEIYPEEIYRPISGTRNLDLSSAREKPQCSLGVLGHLDQALDALSAADSFPGVGYRLDSSAFLDTTLPSLSETGRTNYIEGFPLLQADLAIDQTSLSASIALSLTIRGYRRLESLHFEDRLPAPKADLVLHRIIERGLGVQPHQWLGREDFSYALGPLAEPSKAFPVLPSGVHVSSLASPVPTLVEDITPYVRSIVHYDMMLEDQRLRLSNLLSQGGSNGRKLRTTRASRAALEGGSRPHTRRERWFPDKTNFQLVLRTGGRHWQEALWQDTSTEIDEAAIPEMNWAV